MSIPPSLNVDVLTNAVKNGDLKVAVDVLHDIIEDIIDSAALAASTYYADLHGVSGDHIGQDVSLTTRNYAGNHYGVEDFGL